MLCNKYFCQGQAMGNTEKTELHSHWSYVAGRLGHCTNLTPIELPQQIRHRRIIRRHEGPRHGLVLVTRRARPEFRCCELLNRRQRLCRSSRRQQAATARLSRGTRSERGQIAAVGTNGGTVESKSCAGQMRIPTRLCQDVSDEV